VTTPAFGSGRPSAIHRPGSKTASGIVKFLCIAVLAAAALPAVAQQLQDPLEAPALVASFDGQIENDFLAMREQAYARDMLALFESQTVAGLDAFAMPVKREGRIRTMLNRALALLGTPYRWGGSSPEAGFDCSGLVGYVFRSTLGVELPRISRDMATVGRLVRDPEHLIEGDLVFFSRRGKHVDHVGIYLGGGRFVHAPRTGKNVEISTMATGYWSHKFLKARRIDSI
jgi:cell wall-associated NlpC family hydrolase